MVLLEKFPIVFLSFAILMVAILLRTHRQLILTLDIVPLLMMHLI